MGERAMTGVERWETIDLDIEALIEGATSAQQRSVAAAAAILAAERTGLDEAPVPEAIAVLRDNRTDSGLHARLTELADRLDDEAFDKRDEVDQGTAEYVDYQRIFRRARAATALATAMEDDAKEAAIEGVYEAYHALGSDAGALENAIRSSLGR